MSSVEIVIAEGLVVGPDEILIVRIPDSFPMDDEGEYPFVRDLNDELDRLGLGDRSLIIAGDVELAKAKR